MDNKNRGPLILRWVLGIYFIIVGVMHFIVPEGLPGPMSWMYDLSDTLHTVSGSAEILGGLGLILPGLTKIMPKLTVLAALGLVAVMLSAAVWHSSRGEGQQIAQNVVLAALMAYVAYTSWKDVSAKPSEATAA